LTSPTLNLASDNDKKKSSSAGVIVALIVLVVVILITITIFVVGINIVRKAKKSMQCSKPEGIYYSTIDDTKLQRTTSNKPSAKSTSPLHSSLDDSFNPLLMSQPLAFIHHYAFGLCRT